MIRPPFYLILFAVIVAGCAKPGTVAGPTPAPAPPKPRPVQEEPSPPPAPPKPRPAKEEPTLPPPLLSPQVGRKDEAQLEEEAEAKIKGAEQIVKQIDQRDLVREQQEILSTIRSFLIKAKEALSANDFLRAFNLADKAQILAEGLLSTLR